jgi:hypothetical protein
MGAENKELGAKKKRRKIKKMKLGLGFDPIDQAQSSGPT